jgi:hypothetical protein
MGITYKWDLPDLRIINTINPNASSSEVSIEFLTTVWFSLRSERYYISYR